jgi:pectin methylesterase-like acyl-CoA thioesterase
MSKMFSILAMVLSIAFVIMGCTPTVDGGSSSSSTPTVSGSSSSATSSTTSAYVYFVKQSLADTVDTTTAAISSGTISVHNNTAVGNAFKYPMGDVNGFLMFPTPFEGDFSVSATITINTQNVANNASGIGVGMATGYTSTDFYAYMLMRNKNNNSCAYYTKGTSGVGSGGSTVAFTNGTPLKLILRRSGAYIYWGAAAVGTAITEQSGGVSNFNCGSSKVYAGISFANVDATITDFVISDASGTPVFDSSTGYLVPHIPASLTVSSTSISMNKGTSTSITAVAKAIGGAISNVTAVAADSSIVDVSVTNGASGSTLNLSGLKVGTTTITVTNTNDSLSSTNTKTITVTVNDFATSDNYGTIPAASLYPAIGETAAYTDGEMAITFDNTPTLNVGGSIKIYNYSTGTEVDSIAFASETQTAWSTTLNVDSQLVRVSGNTIYFRPHFGKLAYATKYYVAIPTTAITGTFNGVSTFTGFTNLSSVATWNFTTKSAPTLTATNVTVDGSQTSTADFRSVQGALDSLATYLSSSTDVTINVAAGTYNELVYYKGGKNITLVGPSGNNKGDTCVISYTNGESLNPGTHTRALFYISASNLVMKNITLKNTGVRSVVSQAESIYFANGTGKTMAAYNCSFSSNQDTIQTTGKNWFYNCYIEGNVDFIWGTAEAALFENCSLRVINDKAGQSYSIFVARTGTKIGSTSSGTVGKGYVLLNSNVSIDDGITATFGRDAGTGDFYDQVALINNTFTITSTGSITSDSSSKKYIWDYSTTDSPLKLGDSTYVGWKAVGNTGANLASLTNDISTYAATTIADQSNEYDTRDHILNRVITVTSGSPSGYEAASTTWDTSSLATAFGL